LGGCERADATRKARHAVLGAPANQKGISAAEWHQRGYAPTKAEQIRWLLELLQDVMLPWNLRTEREGS
jgi:hypothetical protein